MHEKSIIDNLPDLSDWNKVKTWLTETEAKVLSSDFASGKKLIPVSYTPPVGDDILGVYGDTAWRKFALALTAADWVCYPKPEDKADFARMLSVVSTFPRGFTAYFLENKNSEALPVGYTGWYPILNDVYTMMENSPEKLTHRGMMLPLRELDINGNNYLYLFNYSITEKLVGTEYSSKLIKDYAETLGGITAKAMAAVTVSPHGKRVAERFGLRYTGDMTHMGDIDGVYCGLKL